MGIFKAFDTKWKAATTAEKIDIILDIICGIGSGAIGLIEGKRLQSHARSKLQYICIPIVTTGLAMKGGDVAKEALMKNVGIPVSCAIDAFKEKRSSTNSKKEDSENGYTRY